MNILEINKVVKSYRNHRALKNVSFSIPKGCIFGLLGPNGAGKTTLLRIINQIIQADTGQITFNGELLAPKHIEQIGYLPEERGLYKKMKVGEQLMYLGQLKGLSSKTIKTRLQYWSERFEMKGWWQKTVRDLSKGMQQKVQFVSTVLHEPDLIILDEPFSGFDPVNADLIQQVILDFRDKGHTILFSTHRMESVEELCQELVLLNKGVIVLEGEKLEVKNRFRTHTYAIETREPIQLPESDFTILSQEKKDNLVLTKARLQEGNTADALLQALIGKAEVLGFREEIPRIHEIFVQLVKN